MLRVLLLVFGCALAIGLGLLVFEPELTTYGGLSGVAVAICSVSWRVHLPPSNSIQGKYLDMIYKMTPAIPALTEQSKAVKRRNHRLSLK